MARKSKAAIADEAAEAVVETADSVVTTAGRAAGLTAAPWWPLVKWTLFALAGVLAVAAISGWWDDLWDWLPWSDERRAAVAERQAEDNRQAAAVAQGEARLDRQVVEVVVAGEARIRATGQIQQENEDALERHADRSRGIDPGLADDFLGGLRRYDSVRAADRLQQAGHPVDAGADAQRADSDPR